MFINWRKMIMIAIFSGIVCWILLQFKGSGEKSDPAPESIPKENLLDELVKTPARKKPDELYRIISSGLNGCDESDTLTLMQDAFQTYIRPNMSETEAYHVRKTFLQLQSHLELLQTHRLYGGYRNEQQANP